MFNIFRKRDGELSIRQKELQLEYRHAQLKEQLNVRLSSGSEWTKPNPFIQKKKISRKKNYKLIIFPLDKIGLDKSSSDVAAEGAILNEMLEIVAKRAALRANDPQHGLNSIESDVSLACCARDFLFKWLIPIILSILFCMFYLHFAPF